MPQWTHKSINSSWKCLLYYQGYSVHHQSHQLHLVHGAISFVYLFVLMLGDQAEITDPPPNVGDFLKSCTSLY